MTFAWTPYALVPALSAAVCLGVGLYIRSRQGAPGGLPYFGLMLAAMLWAGTSALEKVAVGIPAKVLLSKIQYLGIASVPLLWLYFALAYARREDLLNRRNTLLLSLIPSLTVLAAATNDWHHWLWSSITPSPIAPEHLLIYHHGPWFYVAAGYSYLLLLMGSVALIWALVRFPNLYRRQAAALLAGLAVPWLANGVYLAGLNPLPGVDPTPVAFAITGIIYAWGIFRLRLADLRPVAHEAVVDSMRDAVIVLDAAGLVLDLNPAGQKLTGYTTGALVGRLAAEVWPEYATRLTPAAGDAPTISQIEFAAGPGDEPRSFDVRLSPLHGAAGRLEGWTIVLRDVTERIRAEQTLAAANAELQAAMTRANEFARLAQSRAEVADTLRDAGAVVAATMNSGDAIQRILEQLMRVVPCECAWVQVRDGDETELVGGRGMMYVESVIGARFPIEPGRASGTVYLSRQTVVLNDAVASHPLSFTDPRFSYIRSWMGVPLIVHDQIVGLLTLDSRSPNHFTEHHRELAESFATQAGIALENARLFNEVQRLAITDGLTGLYNRRHFYERAEVEFARARRYQHPLSAILIDVDLFKEINDTYGHAVGDVVLQQLAHVFRAHLRATDLLGRYGGEEFVFLLPETDRDGARQVAERMRVSVEALVVVHERVSPRVTISAGVAEQDTDCRSLDTLLDRSDQALYSAKRGGRNRVRVWPE